MGPQWARWARSELDAQPPGAAGALARGAQAAQSLDEHRVGLEGGLRVDQRVEHLVVAGGAHVEELADRLLLGPGVLPPLPFEGDDLAVTVAQLRGDADLTLLVCGVQLSTIPWMRCGLACCPDDMACRRGIRAVQGQLYGANHTLVIPPG